MGSTLYGIFVTMPRLSWRAGLLVALLVGAPVPTGAARADAQPQCSNEVRGHNAELGRTILEDVLGEGRVAEHEHLYHPDFVAHSTRTGGSDATRAEDREATVGWRAAAPNLRVTVERVAADCGFVAVHFRAEGANTGAAMGLPGNGAAFDVQGITMFAVRDGLIAEEWTVFDQFGLLSQLEMLPSPE